MVEEQNAVQTQAQPVNAEAPQQATSANRRLRIVLPGGSGQVGQMLARCFQQQGHFVTVLTRSPFAAAWQTMHWDGLQPGPWTEALEGADVCINLTGRGINCRLTAANRKDLYESRIGSTLLLHRVIAGLNHPPKLWMNASAATIYHRAVDERGVDLPLEESSPIDGADLLPPHQTPAPWARRRGFMARLVRDWEAAFFSTPTPRTRKIALRSAVTFSPAPGNVFAVLSNLVRMSFGGSAGSGRQFVPWIHEADYARAVAFLIAREDLDGPFNLAAPNPIQNRPFMAALREAWDVPNGFPAPSLAVRLGALLMGSNAELVLGSCRAVPGRLLEAGFRFEFPDWPEAAEDLVRQWKNRE
jgi:hypothetical protein